MRTIKLSKDQSVKANFELTTRATVIEFYFEFLMLSFLFHFQKIDFYFFCQLLQENLSYTKISEIVKENYPNVRGFSVSTTENFCKENELPSRFYQSNAV